MTKKQHAVLTFIREYIAKNAYSPSYDEITAVVGYKSKSRVAEIVDALVAQGLLRKAPGASRNLVVVEEAGYSRGYADGYRAAIAERVRHMAPLSAVEPPQSHAVTPLPTDVADCPTFEPSSRRAFSIPTEA